MATASKSKAEATRQRVLDAAARLFREHGYAAVSLRDIAEAAGMQVGSLYYHFESKEQIVTDVLDIGITLVHESVQDTIDDLPAGTPAREAVRTAIRAHLLTLLQFSDYTSANVRIYGQLPKQAQEANLAVRQAYEQCWDRLLQSAAKAGALRPGTDLSAARLLIIGSLNATLEWFDPSKGSVEALADSYADLLLHGLLPDDHGD